MITTIIAITCFFFVILTPVIQYLQDPKCLRRFPSPSVAAFTSIWAMYHNWHGRRYLAVDEAHKRLGAVVRIGPNHVSFSDPAAYKDIYGHGSSIVKDTFYDNLAGSTPSIADTSSRLVHSQKRRNVSSIFSAKNVTALEPKVIASVKKLLQAIKCKSEDQMVSTSDEYPVTNGKFDLRPWMNMFSFDAFSNMMWSSCYNFLERGNDVCFSMDADGTVSSVHAMDSFQTGVHFNTICAQFDPLAYQLSRWLTSSTYRKKAADHFTGMARYLTVQRLKTRPTAPDFFTHLPHEPLEKKREPMQLSELVAECTTFLNAGNDTTQISLTNTMFELASHPVEQKKLYEELTKSIGNVSTPLRSYSELSQIPYLRACIDETFRILPPVRFGLLRQTVDGGAMIAGHHIPEGVTVSSSVYTLHRYSSLFHSPLEWKPERWLQDSEVSEAERKNLQNFVLPFTLGGRACIGRNLAYMELSICLAAMVMSFEFSITHEAEDDFQHFERLNSSPVSLLISAKARPEVAGKI